MGVLDGIASTVGALAQPAASIVGSVLGYKSNQEANSINRNVALYNAYMQNQQFDYARALQKTIFEREDNAISRQVADLERNGLNKQLVAGGAGAGSVVSTSAPSVDYQHRPYQPSIEFGNGLLQLGDFLLRAKLQREQIENIRADTNNKNIAGAYSTLKMETEKLDQLKSEQDIISKKNANSVMSRNMDKLVEEQAKKVSILDSQLMALSLDNHLKQRTLSSNIDKSIKDVEFANANIRKIELDNLVRGAELQDIQDYQNLGLTSKGKSKTEGLKYITEGLRKIPIVGPLFDFLAQDVAYNQARFEDILNKYRKNKKNKKNKK